MCPCFGGNFCIFFSIFLPFSRLNHYCARHRDFSDLRGMFSEVKVTRRKNPAAACGCIPSSVFLPRLELSAPDPKAGDGGAVARKMLMCGFVWLCMAMCGGDMWWLCVAMVARMMLIVLPALTGLAELCLRTALPVLSTA